MRDGVDMCVRVSSVNKSWQNWHANSWSLKTRYLSSVRFHLHILREPKLLSIKKAVKLPQITATLNRGNVKQNIL